MIIIIRNQCYHIDFIESKISKFFFLLEFKKLTDLFNLFQYLHFKISFVPNVTIIFIF